MSNTRDWKSRQRAEAERFGLHFGGTHPETGMIWMNPTWVTREAFERTKRGNLLRMAMLRCKKTGRSYGLSQKWLDENWPKDGKCPVLGVTLTWGEGDFSNSPSIDRVDSTKDYTPDNCRVICRRANTIKSDATLRELALVFADALRLYGSADN